MQQFKHPEFAELHERFKREIKLQGKSPKTIDSYARSLRRLLDYFDCHPAELSQDDLKLYFSDLVASRSWSVVRVDRWGLRLLSRNRFLIPARVLNRLFRGKFLSSLKEQRIGFASSLYRKEWVVDCRFSGKGDSALTYLARYLYRGVISERNILSHQDGQVTFRYLYPSSQPITSC